MIFNRTLNRGINIIGNLPGIKYGIKRLNDAMLHRKKMSDIDQSNQQAFMDGLNGLYRGLPIHEWGNTNNLDRLYNRHGVFKSTKMLSVSDKFDANQFFQYRDKSEVAMCVASIYPGGDYMEFGSTDLNTFRNFLSAFDIFNLQARFPDMRFYGFDIFGSMDASDETNVRINEKTGYRNYIDNFAGRGDVYRDNVQVLNEHGLFVDQCQLIQGFFEETLNDDYKLDYLKQGRKVGFACLDCNIAPPYKVVFEFLIDVINTNSCFIYMDEYYSASVSDYFDQFMAELERRHNMKARLIRNAGGFGALFYLYASSRQLPRLEFNEQLSVNQVVKKDELND